MRSGGCGFWHLPLFFGLSVGGGGGFGLAFLLRCLRFFAFDAVCGLWFVGWRLCFKVNININVKGFRSPGATYFLFPEKKVGKESGLPGRQGQKHWDSRCCWFRRGVFGSACILPLPGRAAAILLATVVSGSDL
ncbi:hypothetical protein AB4Z48_03425 [Cupriavidus sp. 2TAF22]|uniref:hypothetical protein n=1 Tax=unclassified Cupriavidus TaxID=2640874 RepID=UPI003F8FFD50